MNDLAWAILAIGLIGSGVSTFIVARNRLRNWWFGNAAKSGILVTYRGQDYRFHGALQNGTYVLISPLDKHAPQWVESKTVKVKSVD